MLVSNFITISSILDFSSFILVSIFAVSESIKFFDLLFFSCIYLSIKLSEVSASILIFGDSTDAPQ